MGGVRLGGVRLDGVRLGGVRLGGVRLGGGDVVVPATPLHATRSSQVLCDDLVNGLVDELVVKGGIVNDSQVLCDAVVSGS